MEIKQEEIGASGIKFFIEKEGKEVARASLFFMYNDLHEEPFGLMEDVFVEEEYRNQGIGTQLAKVVIEAAKTKCYKLICTSRHARKDVHKLYQRLEFKNHGIEFRMDF
jgi:GNAT superfamily N-acetyltransferase